MPKPLATVAAVVLAVVALAGCTGEPTPMPTPTPTPTPTPSGDGVLKIGTLFPSSGGVGFIGPAQVAGVNAAVREINAAGGVNGEPVVVLNRDSGDASTQKVEESFADLVAQGVDVVIGPSSSVLAQRLLGPAAEAGIPLISPAATYPQLTALDTDDVFFRTIASYPHQAIVLARELAAADVDSVVLVSREGDLAGSLAAAFELALEAEAEGAIGLSLVEVAADAAGEALAAAVAEVTGAEPDAVVLATPDNGEQTRSLIALLTTAGFGGDKLWLTSQNVADYSQSISAGVLNGVHGVLDGATIDAAFQAKIKQEDPAVGVFSYAAEAYDAVVLAALAAELAGDDGSASIAWKLRDASVGGIKCTSFGECLDVLVTQPDIDYDGISGSVNLDADGEPERGTFTLVVYNGENKYAVQGNRIG